MNCGGVIKDDQNFLNQLFYKDKVLLNSRDRAQLSIVKLDLVSGNNLKGAVQPGFDSSGYHN